VTQFGFGRYASNVTSYLSLLERARIVPNHFTSAAYITAAGWVVDGGRVYDEAGLVFPPVCEAGMLEADGDVWVDFEGYAPRNASSEAFDREYIYRAGAFWDLSGGAFKVLRKNVRKVEALNPEWCVCEFADAAQVFVDWADTAVGRLDSLEDGELVLRYLRERGAIWGVRIGGKLAAVVACDVNYWGVNFRYCFALDDPPYASEFARVRFYRMLEPDTLVNDGGDLGQEGLAQFKRKLRPVEVRVRRSWNAVC